MPKKPTRDRHALGVTRSIERTYRPKPAAPGKPSRTVLKKTMRQKKRP